MAARKTRTGPSESSLVTAILRALKLKGVWAWRNNSSLTVLPAQASHGRRVIKGGEAGSPDIFVVLPARHEFVVDDGVMVGVAIGVAIGSVGTLCGIEVKTATGKLLPSQVAWHAKAERHGVRVGVARSIGEAVALVKKWSGKADGKAAT